MSIGSDLLNVPMGQMIRSMAMAIADAQFALDKSSVKVAAMMSGHELVLVGEGGPAPGTKLPPGYIQLGDNVFRDTRVAFGYYDKVEVKVPETPGAHATGKLSISNQKTVSVMIPAGTVLICDEDHSRWTVKRNTLAATATTSGQNVIPSTTPVEIVCESVGKIADDTFPKLDDEATVWRFLPTVPNLAAKGTGVAGDFTNGSDPVAAITETTREANLVSMMELGFTPNFYQFVDTIIEVKITIKMTKEENVVWTYSQNTKSTDQSASWDWRSGYDTNTTVQTTQVDGTYSSKYNYSAEGSSFLRTKLVPIPPPAILEERIRGMLEANKANPKIDKKKIAGT